MRSFLQTSKSSLQEIKSTKKHDDIETLATVARSISLNAAGGKQRIIAHGHGIDVYTFRELASATENFNPELVVGEGGFGRVFKGTLKKTNQVVAVKKLDKNVQENKEFLGEVLKLGMVHHPNLVKLTGYCADGHQRLLVFEYMHNGSLEHHLFDLPPDKKALDWHARMQIARGAARGLEYLQDTMNPPIIFGEFKACNILLDEQFDPKLCGFGLAKTGLTIEDGPFNTRAMGTYGYCAPEYTQTGKWTTKSDVYSFGVVLLEIIAGRRVIDSRKPPEEENLVAWAKPLLKDKRQMTQIADPLLEGKYPEKGLYQALAVAAMCLQDEASTRPQIDDVVTTLEYLAVTTDEVTNETQTDV